MKQIAVIDYGMGNLRSVAKAVEHVAGDAKVVVTDSPAIVASADHVVFPGQGAAAECMAALHRHELEGVIREAATNKPFLGICMGMQVLMAHSAENKGVDCLGWFAGNVKPFAEKLTNPDLKIPHMGWNQVKQLTAHPLWNGIDDQSRFYFVHSYYVEPEDASVSLATTDYGIDFTSAVGRDNVFAVQCHPEKSAAVGLQLLKNFVEWDGQA